MAEALYLRFKNCSSWSERTKLFEELFQSTAMNPQNLGPFLPFIQDTLYGEPLSARKLAYECAVNLIVAVPSMLEHFKSSLIIALLHEKVHVSRTALNFLPRIVSASMNAETSTALLEAAHIAVNRSPTPEACSNLALAVSASMDK